jgi:hypothetical protein
VPECKQRAGEHKRNPFEDPHRARVRPPGAVCMRVCNQM